MRKLWQRSIVQKPETLTYLPTLAYIIVVYWYFDDICYTRVGLLTLNKYCEKNVQHLIRIKHTLFMNFIRTE